MRHVRLTLLLSFSPFYLLSPKNGPTPPLSGETRNRSPHNNYTKGQTNHRVRVCACSGPRCVALFDYEGEEEDELTFSQGDVVRLLQLIGAEWGRGQIHGRVGVFPLNFVEVVQPPGGEPAATLGAVTGPTGGRSFCLEAQMSFDLSGDALVSTECSFALFNRSRDAPGPPP